MPVNTYLMGGGGSYPPPPVSTPLICTTETARMWAVGDSTSAEKLSLQHQTITLPLTINISSRL